MRPLGQRLARAALRAAMRALRALPEPLAYALADLATPLVAAFALLHEARVSRRGRGLFRNLRIAWRDELGRVGALRLFLGWARHVARLAVDFARLPRLDAARLERHLDVAEIRGLEPLARSGSGLICVSAHAGFWELCGHAPSVLGTPVTVVVRPRRDGALDEVLNEIRRSGGQRVLGKWQVLWPLKKTLDRGGVVGLLADEDERRRPVFAPFLGTPAATTPVPAFLQRVSGAPIAVVTCPRVGRGRFRFRVWCVIPPPAGDVDGEKHLVETTEAINEALSRAIRTHPEQWLWGSRRFATRPPGERPGRDGLPPRAS